MSKRKILTYPHPRLTRKAEGIAEITDDVVSLAEDMLETMYDAPGIGLAGPQVGVLKRIFVMDCALKEEAPDPRVLINPECVWVSDETEKREEGCLSLPNHFAEVVRPSEVRMRFWDLDGTDREETFSDLQARCAQHELDHLDGKLFIDRISYIKRQMIKRKIAKERDGKSER